MNDRMFDSPVYVKNGENLILEIAGVDDAIDFTHGAAQRVSNFRRGLGSGVGHSGTSLAKRNYRKGAHPSCGGQQCAP